MSEESPDTEVIQTPTGDKIKQTFADGRIIMRDHLGNILYQTGAKEKRPEDAVVGEPVTVEHPAHGTLTHEKHTSGATTVRDSEGNVVRTYFAPDLMLGGKGKKEDKDK